MRFAASRDLSPASLGLAAAASVASRTTPRLSNTLASKAAVGGCSGMRKGGLTPLRASRCAPLGLSACLTFRMPLGCFVAGLPHSTSAISTTWPAQPALAHVLCTAGCGLPRRARVLSGAPDQPGMAVATARARARASGMQHAGRGTCLFCHWWPSGARRSSSLLPVARTRCAYYFFLMKEPLIYTSGAPYVCVCAVVSCTESAP